MPTRAERVLVIGSVLALAVILVALCWTAATISVEYYDGFEFLQTGAALVSPVLYFRPKHILLSSWLGACAALVDALGLPRSLAPYHLAMLVLNGAAGLAILAWIRRRVPGVAWPVIALLLVANRLVLHYTPFALGDLMLAGLIALWALLVPEDALDHARGSARAALVITLCLLARPQVVLIPLVVLVSAIAARPGRIIRAAGVFGTGALLFLGLAGWFSAHGLGLSLGDGLDFHLGFLRSFTVEAVTFPRGPWWATPLHLLLAFSPIVVILAIAGLRQAALIPGADRALLVASGVYLLVLTFGPIPTETRYLAPVWPALALLATRGIVSLQKRFPLILLLALAAQALYGGMELARFRDPFYSANLHEKISRRVAEWSGTRVPVFVTPMAALFPRDHVFSIHDGAFYLYSWNRAAHSFFTGMETRELPFIASFSEAGYPRPDGAARWLGADAVAVVPGAAAYRTENLPRRMEHIHLLRKADTVVAGGDRLESISLDPNELVR